MKTFNELCKVEVIELAKLAVEMQNTNVEILEKLEAANHDYEELMKERTDYVAENKRLRKLLRDAQQYIRPLDPKYKEIEQALKGK